jgi:hypothetical protein
MPKEKIREWNLQFPAFKQHFAAVRSSYAVITSGNNRVL